MPDLFFKEFTDSSESVLSAISNQSQLGERFWKLLASSLPADKGKGRTNFQQALGTGQT